jgi:hypothetical protein
MSFEIKSPQDNGKANRCHRACAVFKLSIYNNDRFMLLTFLEQSPDISKI